MGASAAMVPWPFRFKFGKKMGTHPGMSVPMFGLGTPNSESEALKWGSGVLTAQTVSGLLGFGCCSWLGL